MVDIKSFFQSTFIIFFVLFGVIANAAQITAFDDKQFVRTTGAPNIYTETFTAEPGEAVLTVRNGEAGANDSSSYRITSGTISLNGEILFSHDDFKHQTYILEIPVTLQENNTLYIELESKPGDYISLEVIQTIPDPVYDLLASDLRVDSNNCPESVAVSLDLVNNGEDTIPAGTQISFYNGHPDENGTLIGTASSHEELVPLVFETISLQWNNPTVSEAVLYARVDDDGTGTGQFEEVDETNNLISIDAVLCQVAPGDSSLSGHIIDAVNGDMLAGVQVLLHVNNSGQPGAVVASSESSDEGIYLFSGLASGSYIATATHQGYIENERSVELTENTELINQDIPLSPVLEENEIRIILTWNETPADLEAHLTAPSEEGCRYHCYYFNKTIPTASLDLDDRNGYGPETITITDRVSGTYRYYVHDFTNRYSNSYWLSRSGAEVKVFYGDREPMVFTVPSGYGNVWHVFDLDGNSGEITPVNNMSRQSEPGRIDYPTINSWAPGTAYWSSLYTYQVDATDPDNDILTYSLSQAPEGMTIDPETGLIEWTPTGAQSGYYYVTVNVEDGRCGEATQSFRIYVNSYPVAQFTVDPCSGYNPGGTITLTWSTTRASTVLIDQGIGEVPASGSLTLPSPDEPILYTLTAFNDAALTKREVPANPYAYISFSPRYIYEGDSTTLSWDPRCYASATLDHGIGEVDGPGSLVITPTETTTYCLTVTNGAATRKYCATVYIQQPPPPPSPTAYLNIGPNCNLTPGEPLTLTWSTTNATEITISPDIGAVEPSGSLQVFPENAGSYTLTATGPGGTATRKVYYPNNPSLSFWTSSYGIDIGDPVTLSWSASCMDTLVMNQGIGELTASGSMTVTPDVLPITYTITATNERGPVSRSVTLYQIAPSGRLTADPTIMKVGDSTTLTWTSSRATSCSISPDIGPVALNGSMSITPTQPTSYRLTIQGAGGSRTYYASVGFVYPIADLKASSLTINEGDTVQLTWIYANATRCYIDQGIGDVELGGERTVAPAATTTYTMTATGPGGTVTDKVTINVIPSGQPPVVSLSANPSIIMHGDSTVLIWNGDYTDTLTIEPDIGIVANTGSATVSPEQTTTYTATATGPGGTIIERELVTVVQPPPTMTLLVEPASVAAGESAVLSWSSSDVDTIVFDQGIGEVSPQGSLTVSPGGTTLYTATATGPGGTLTKRVSLNVIHPKPTINFTASPSSIQLGDSTTLNWSTENAGTVTIRPGLGEVETSGTITLSPEQSTIYYLTATGVDSEVVAQVTVTVIQPEPTATLNATPSTITLDESTMLSWTTEHARTCSLAPDISIVDCTGQMEVAPDRGTTYVLTATGLGGTATDETTVTVTYPVPIAIISADPLSLTTGESSTLSWSSQYGEICSIAPDIGEVACNGEMTVTPEEDTTYILTVSNLGANTTAEITVSVTPPNPISLAITSPADGAVISRPDIMVKGTVNHSEALETGVTVNGVIALVHGNQFIANHVRLLEGENTITVRATDVHDTTLEQSVTVTADPVARYIELDTDTQSGLAPLKTMLSFDANFAGDEPIDIIYTGPSTVEFTDGIEDYTWNISMIEPGLYTFAVELQDSDGTTYRDEVAVQVYDRSVLDALLQRKWDGMKEALVNVDIKGGLSYFLRKSQNRYSDAFNAIIGDLPHIFSGLPDIEMIYAKERRVKYRVNRTHDINDTPITITYYIYFVKDAGGIWKIEQL